MPTQLFVGPKAPSGKKTYGAQPRACARSAQSSSASSRPTLRRSRPGGTRSPSQRVAALEHRVDAAEAGRVLDQPQRGLDLARGLGVCDVEREQPAEARVADDLDRRVVAQPLGERRRARGDGAPCAPGASSACASSSQHGSGAATIPVRPRNSRRRSASSAERQATAPSSTSWWPPRYLVALCSGEVGAVLERAQVDRRRGGRVDHDARRDGAARPRGPAWSGTGSTAPRARRGRRLRAAGRLVELDVANAPALERRRRARPVP